MKDLPDSDIEPVVDPLTLEIDDPTPQQQVSASHAKAITPFNKVQYVDMKQPGGRWAPIFPCSLCMGTAEEEEFLARLIEKDDKENLV